MALAQTLTQQGGVSTGTDTYTAMPLGTASSDRAIAILISTASAPSSITIGGVAAIFVTNGSLGTDLILATAYVPTGTTGDVVATGAGSFNVYGCWAITGGVNLNNTSFIAQAGSASPSISVLDGGVILGVCFDFAGVGPTVSFSSGISNEGTDWTVTGAPAHNGGGNFATAQSVTCSISGATVAGSVLVALAPNSVFVQNFDANSTQTSVRSQIIAVALTAGAIWVPTAPTTPINSKSAGWYQPLAATPASPKVQLGSIYTPFVSRAVPQGWEAPLSVAPPVAEPVQSQFFVPFNTAQVAPPVPYGWLSIPSYTAPITKAQLGSSFVPFDTRQTNTAYGWYAPISATPPAPAVQYGSFFVPLDTRQTNTAYGWYSPLYVAPPVAQAQLGSFFVPLNAPQNIVTPPWGWHQALSATPPAPSVQFGATFVPFNTAQITTTWGWVQGFAITPPAPAAQAGSAFVPFNTAQITPAPPFGWFQSLASTPASPESTQSSIWTPDAPFITVSLAWQQGLAATPASPAVQPGSFTLVYSFTTPSNTVLGFAWQQPLSVPIPPIKPQAGSSFVPFNATQVIITPPWGWFAPLSTAPPIVQAQPSQFFVPFNTAQIPPALSVFDPFVYDKIKDRLKKRRAQPKTIEEQVERSRRLREQLESLVRKRDLPAPIVEQIKSLPAVTKELGPAGFIAAQILEQNIPLKRGEKSIFEMAAVDWVAEWERQDEEDIQFIIQFLSNL